MAEISDTESTHPNSTESEPLNNPQPSDLDPQLKFDEKTMRKSKPGIKRLILISTVLFSFISGLPFLLKSIEIYRSPLPFAEIDMLANSMELNRLYIPCRFQAVFLGFGDISSEGESDVEKLGFMITDQMSRLIGEEKTCGGCSENYTVSVTKESNAGCFKNSGGVGNCLWKCGGEVDFGSKDEEVDELLDSALRRDESCGDTVTGGRVYTVFVVKKEGEVRVVVGRHRHAWMMGEVTEMNAVPMIASVFVKVFMNGGKERGLVQGEFMPVGADGRVVLSFSLLNADPHDWIYEWDFKKVEDSFLVPVVEALEAVANISVESQVLYHTPKSSLSIWDERLSGYVFSTKDLPFFVNSNEWHLDTSIAAGGRSKILHFVVYIPSEDECPLLLQLPNGKISPTNGFISPMWGGVIVWNPSSCLKNSSSRHPVRHTLSPQELEKVFEVFMGQLRQLFGLNSDNHLAKHLDVSSFLVSESGFTDWELDALSRYHTCANLISCVTTLGSLSKLVQSLPRMIIKEEIGKQVKVSLEAASLAQRNASLGIYDSSTVLSRQAKAVAEDAFFHPSIMSISYYSFEHCFAIYTPFFLPVSLHILLAAIKELKRYRREKAKYFTWMAR
ncbi:hypothetical protein ACHQM5_026985 [Ranunculus cassubicifolius]